MWRSLVAYTPGGRGVAGSNPVISTKRTGNNSVVGFLCFGITWKLLLSNIYIFAAV
jgi:hypothetical protein